MSEVEKKIKKLIDPILEKNDVYFVGLKLRGPLNSQVLSVYLDTDSGITLQQLTEMTHSIEDILDIKDPIQGRYRLDVSSPGVDWPLTSAWQFRKNLNRNLHIKYTDEGENKEITAILSGVTGEHIELRFKGQIIEIPLDKIINAVVKLNW